VAVKDRAVTTKFERAIVKEALTFAQKVLMLSDPAVQSEHEQGLSESRSGKGISLEEFRKSLNLAPR
jgi:hypothetical protein